MTESEHMPAGSLSKGPLTAILLKELREGWKSAAVGLLVVAAGLAMSLLMQRSMASNGGPSIGLLTFPHAAFIMTTVFVGLMMGRAQVISEHRGDRWGFLTHRPVTRTTLFQAKALAGVLLYVVATGVPLTWAMVWVATPGNMPFPFAPRMALPGLADLLCGVVYVFAGMLISMRDARWYVSRGLGVGTALICSFTVVAVTSSFWSALAAIAVGALVVGTAAWGTFIAGGRYEPQPAISRAAVGASSLAGLYLVGAMAAGILSGILTLVVPHAKGHDRVSQVTKYQIASDGTLVQTVTELHVIPPSSQIVAVNDSSGHALDQFKDSVGRSHKLSAGVMSPATLRLAQNAGTGVQNPGYRETGDLFVPLVQSRDPADPMNFPVPVSWYFIQQDRLIAAYDNASRRLIGWLGPDGFSAGSAHPARRFSGPVEIPAGFYPGKWIEDQSVISFPDAVYRLDLSHRRLQQLFVPPTGESVLGAAQSVDSAPALVATYGKRAEFIAVSTTKQLYLLSLDGTPQLTAPVDPRASGYGTVSVSRALLAPGSPTFFRFSAAGGTLSGPPLKTAHDQITVFGQGDTVVARYAVPFDTASSATGQSVVDWTSVVLSIAVPVTARFASNLAARLTGDRHFDTVGGWLRSLFPKGVAETVGWVLALLAEFGAAAVAYTIGRAYAFSKDRLRVWSALGFILGPIGVPLMLALIEWPAREGCPACKRKRVVTRERCEHCDAPFAPPPVNSTEIFEALAAP